VAKGVKPEDYGRALELLLRQSAAFPKEPGVVNYPVWFEVAAIAIAIVALLVSLPSRTAFEIGRGTAVVSRQKRYDWFLRKAIPTFLILGVAASALGSYLFELLRPK
jgi:H+/Cl- antiporter ClcA